MILLLPSLLLFLPPTGSSYLYESCKSSVRVLEGTEHPGIDSSASPYCLGFAKGFMAETDRRICLPPHTGLGPVARAYIAYMDLHPPLMDQPEEVGFAAALLSAYPCTAKKP